MKAMLLDAPGRPLRAADVEAPVPGPGQVLLRVHACGVCRTDLHVRDGELTRPKLPLILGHQIVGTVVDAGPGVEWLAAGSRVGVPWLGWTCESCPSCRRGRENLCDGARFHGYDLDGGFAELAVADARYAFPIPPGFPDLQAAPLLCAGLIGHRALRMAGDAARLGLFGFGAAAHIVIQVARYEGREVLAFTRDGDEEAQSFARELGAVWAGGATQRPPEPLDAAIIFAPAGELVPAALAAVGKGGVVVCAGIHMSDIPSFPYRLLWEERVVRSVANLTRSDAQEFLALAPRIPVRTEVRAFPLEAADEALDTLRRGELRGAAVLAVSTRPATLTGLPAPARSPLRRGGPSLRSPGRSDGGRRRSARRGGGPPRQRSRSSSPGRGGRSPSRRLPAIG
jgi:propanol-preferring alcohol dehydrogenase